MKRRYRRGRRNECMPAIAVAFGLGLFLALIGSFKLILIVAAAAIIYLALCGRPC